MASSGRAQLTVGMLPCAYFEVGKRAAHVRRIAPRLLRSAAACALLWRKARVCMNFKPFLVNSGRVWPWIPHLDGVG